MNKERIDKIISASLNIPRNMAKLQIRRGKVKVDGTVVRDPSLHFDPNGCEIDYKGETVGYNKFRYIMLNKPKGVLSASSDKTRKTVVDLVDESIRRFDLAPVGRLDKDTTGLILITNDGEFAHNVISPKKAVEKTYIATLDGEIPQSAIELFKSGVVLADGTKCLPATLEIIEPCVAKVVIMEGKYHQIKRMFGAIDLGVNEIKRIAIGGLLLPDNLSEGDTIELTNDQILQVFNK
jgi:16S rRNA pseudouridine516 synthase